MLRAAEERYAKAARLAAAAARLAAHAWERVLLDALDAWRPAKLVNQIVALQLIAAQDADPYLDAVLYEQNLNLAASGTVDPLAFVGVTGDGRSLLSLLDEPRIAAKTAIGQGLGAQKAWDRARISVQTMSVTAVQDAGRGADSVAMVARPAVTGYVRMLNLPSCARCTVLAGKFFEWNQGFARHPRCDCRHVPTSEDVSGDLRTDPEAAVLSGQVTGLSRADAQAIQDGADVGQVINAQRGMYTADAFGVRVKATREGVTKRGQFGKADRAAGRSSSPRLRPEAIYKIAGDDREEALRLLRRFGYLT